MCSADRLLLSRHLYTYDFFPTFAPRPDPLVNYSPRTLLPSNNRSRSVFLPARLFLAHLSLGASGGLRVKFVRHTTIAEHCEKGRSKKNNKKSARRSRRSVVSAASGPRDLTEYADHTKLRVETILLERHVSLKSNYFQNKNLRLAAYH